MAKNNPRTDWADPRYLDIDHPLRNALLVNVCAEFKHPDWDEFMAVTHDGGKFAGKSYNDLSRGWTDFYKWRVKPSVSGQTSGQSNG